MPKGLNLGQKLTQFFRQLYMDFQLEADPASAASVSLLEMQN